MNSGSANLAKGVPDSGSRRELQLAAEFSELTVNDWTSVNLWSISRGERDRDNYENPSFSTVI